MASRAITSQLCPGHSLTNISAEIQTIGGHVLVLEEVLKKSPHHHHALHVSVCDYNEHGRGAVPAEKQ